MTTLVWNCKGMGTPGAIRALLERVRLKSPKNIFLSETILARVVFKRFEGNLGLVIWKRWKGLAKEAKLGLLWKSEFRQIKAQIRAPLIRRSRSPKTKYVRPFTKIYVFLNGGESHLSWALLRDLSNDSLLPWCIGGILTMFFLKMSITERRCIRDIRLMVLGKKP